MTYKAIGFDYGGVLSEKLAFNFNARASQILDMPIEDYQAAYFKVNYRINTGLIDSWEEFWEQFLTELGKGDKLDAFMRYFSETSKAHVRVNTSMIQLVDRLAEKYKVGLLSNNTKEGGKLLRDKQLDKHFSVFHISAETGLMKPDTKAFKIFIDALGVLPEQLIFIDDSEKSLSTATEVGFTPVKFVSYENLLIDLAKLRII